MGRSWLLSSLLHTALAALLWFGLPSWGRPLPAMEGAITVELVSEAPDDPKPPEPAVAALAPEPEREAARPPPPRREPEPKPEPAAAPTPEPPPPPAPEPPPAATPLPEPPPPPVAAPAPPPAPRVEPPPPPQPEKVAEPEPAPQPEPEIAAAKPEPPPQPKPAPKQQAALEPEPRPQPEAPSPKPQPEPPPKPQVQPKPAPPKQAAKPEPPQPEPPKPTPAMAPKSEPPPEQQEPPKEDDLAWLRSVEETIERKQAEIERAGTGRAVADAAGQARTELGAAPLSIAETDAVMRQIGRCWRLPAGIDGVEDMVVKLRIQVRPDRSVYGVEIKDQARLNRDPKFRAVAESARRAVEACSPLSLPPDKYVVWRDIIMNFHPEVAISG